MERATDIAEIVVVLLAPVGLIYSWHFYLTQMNRESAGWRNRVTLLSLALVSLVTLLWPVMFMLMPRADWGSGLGVGHQVESASRCVHNLKGHHRYTLTFRPDGSGMTLTLLSGRPIFVLPLLRENKTPGCPIQRVLENDFVVVTGTGTARDFIRLLTVELH